MDDSQIYTLSVCQPWAWALVAGHKRVENRTWNVNYRGPLVIHASGRQSSRRWLRDGPPILEAAGFDVPPEAVDVGGGGLFVGDDALHFGALLGVVNLVDVVAYDDREHDAFGRLQDDPLAFGPVCWIVEPLERFETPIARSGQCGLYPVDRSLMPEFSSP